MDECEGVGFGADVAEDEVDDPTDRVVGRRIPSCIGFGSDFDTG